MEEGRARKIMVVLEDSENGIYVLKWALNYLVPPPSDLAIGPDHFMILYLSPQALSKTMNIKEAYFDCVKRICENHNVTYEMKAMVGEAKLVICEAAKKLEVDLLVIGNHDYGRLKSIKNAF
ncbi:uncharacterized protein LOC131227931 [Magnolia sinica]|uniref:uncharacterized protein LOC131227931 n=1 Tax=Magnolia sinica TaxID=86752 RepID=UPI00265B7212|nr:uncharacterized protein LOC131227931 [Magnolia sinica]